MSQGQSDSGTSSPRHQPSLRRSGAGAQRRAATAKRLLETFSQLVAERGIAATTTRVLASATGVNEVSIFRHFGDKRTLIRCAFEQARPVERIASYPLPSDADAAELLVGCLRFLRGQLKRNAGLFQIGLGEYWNFPELHETFAGPPRAAHQLVQRALEQAATALRPEVDPPATAFSLLGLVLLSVIWQSHKLVDMSDAEWEEYLERAVHLLLRPPD